MKRDAILNEIKDLKRRLNTLRWQVSDHMDIFLN